MVLLGIAFLLVGAVLVYLVTSDDDDDGGGSADPGVAVVVVPTEDVEPGALADDLIAAGSLEEKEIPLAQRLPDAVGSIASLKGAAFISGFAKNQQINAAGVRLANVRGFDVPEGFEAVAVQIDFVAGAAEYVGPGDKINLYSVDAVCPVSGQASIPVDELCPYGTPRAELLLSNIDVLDVSNQTAPRRTQTATDPSAPAPARAAGESVTYLLAIPVADVEKVVFQTSFQTFYVTLVAENAPPVGPTNGRDSANIHED
jgi:Flp pilus assembly protein CpaB